MRVVGASVRGTVHERDGLPNQDAIAWSSPGGPEPHLVAAVSDGHGSNTSFRSHRGAHLAVQVGVETGQGLVRGLGAGGLARLDEHMSGLLMTEIVERWTDSVRADLAAHPFRDEELDDLRELEGPDARASVVGEPVLAYGATLLVAVVVEAFALLVQLGDGDILMVPASGAPARPFPADPRLMGNETTSLCMRHAEREFRSACLPVPMDGATVFLLASDGLSNAYPDEDAFLQVGTDLMKRVVSNGMDAVGRELEDYLREASQHSGDDVTVAVICTGPTTT